MKNEYYKLSLIGTSFWTIDDNDNIDYGLFVKRENDLLNSVYFTKINDNTFKEKLTGRFIVINNNKVSYPLGVDIPLSNLTPCSSFEVLNSFNELKKSNLLIEYNKILENLLVYSNSLEVFKENIEDIYKK